MKALLFVMAISLSAVTWANCAPDSAPGDSSEIRSIIPGTKSTGEAAKHELSRLKTTTVKDAFGRGMYQENNRTIRAVQTNIIEKDCTATNARIDRYCSESAAGNDAACVSSCVKWTVYYCRP